MEVGRIMLIEIHTDDNSKKSANFRHILNRSLHQTGWPLQTGTGTCGASIGWKPDPFTKAVSGSTKNDTLPTDQKLSHVAVSSAPLLLRDIRSDDRQFPGLLPLAQQVPCITLGPFIKSDARGFSRIHL
jgi:hypothetical protein